MKKWLVSMLLALTLGSISTIPAHSTEKEKTGKTLVAFFSCTGTTKAVAQKLATTLGADLYEIVPTQPYTSADLNWRDKSSRSNNEHKNLLSRPAITKTVDLTQYDTILLGYPIWWGEAPRILSTFLESCNFSGKKLIPFCTSGGSGFGKSDAQLKKLTPSAHWLAGREFHASDSQSEVKTWLSQVGLIK